MQWRWREWFSAKSPYLLTIALTAVIGLWFLQPWSMGAGDVFSAGEDIVALQTTVTGVANAGPFGTDVHIAWPVGSNPWAFPQLGMAVLISAWIFAGLLGLSTGASALIVFFGAMIATGVSVLYLLRSFVRNELRWLAASLATAAAVSPFFLVKIGHLNIAVFYIVPLVLAIVIRGVNHSRRWRITAIAVVFVATAIASLWWVIVLLLLLPVVMIALVLQRNWRTLGWTFTVAIGLGFGAMVQYLLYRSARIPDADLDRSLWAANVYGGKFTDLILASPLFNTFLTNDQYDVLREGASVEYKPLGIICALMVVALVLLAIKLMPRYVKQPQPGTEPARPKPVDTTMLASLSIISILFFLTGGFGTVQAAAAILLGGQSPARGFSRFAIILAILGMAWVLLYLVRDLNLRAKSNLALQAVAAIAILGIAAFDLSALPGPAKIPIQSLPEYPPIQYLQANTSPCPVAQLPQEGAPIPRAIEETKTDRARARLERDIYYRGYYAYLTAPEYFWSIGSYIPDRPSAITDLGTTFAAAGMESLKQAGFCAVLYDKRLAEVEKAAKLEGVTRAADLPAPGFSSERYDLYLLK